MLEKEGPETPLLDRSDAADRCNSSGNLAMLTAMRRASSLVSSFAADLRPGSSSKQTYASACPLWSRTTKQAGCSSTDQGGGRRRAGLKLLHRNPSQSP
jgi:hypothetical protein